MKIQTKNFGEMEYEKEEVITFSEGLFGFDDEKEFLLIRFDNESDALLALQEQGLNVEIALQASDSVTKNYVIGMDPEAGTSLSTGSLVTLYVSAGPSVTYTTVPDVVGMEKSEALYTLQQRGLICTESEIRYVSAGKDMAGKVIWQNYGSGTSVINGTKVYIQIGVGPDGRD